MVDDNMINEIGNKYGKLTVVDRAPNNKHRCAMFICNCECGNVVVVRGTSLRNGKTKSCGCLQKELARNTIQKYNCSEAYIPPTNYKHGMAHSRLYNIWNKMIQRCTNQNADNYCYYGGRGILVCDEWKNDFSAFKEWALTNGYDDSLSIDRKNPEGNYCPENCKWSTKTDQARNKRDSIKITINNLTLPLSQWCEIYNCNYKTAHAKYKKGILPEEIFGI